MQIRDYLEEILVAYAGVYGETDSVHAFRLFTSAFVELTNRKKNLAGHVTGSALVWHKPSECVLRVYHAKLRRWVFSAGGHIEDGEWPWEASVRELREETGITATPLFNRQKPMPLIVDAHPIPASVEKSEPAHWHYDMIYLFGVDQKPEICADPAEVARFHWVEVPEVTTENSPVDLREQMLKYVS